MVLRDSLFDAQWLRTAGHSGSGGAELGECFAAARQIREADAASWFHMWYELATRIFAEARKSGADGHTTDSPRHAVANLRASGDTSTLPACGKDY